jgi:hypothetical protein
MRSPRGLAGSITLIAGVAVAFASGVIFNAGASEILHVAMGLCFLLLASAVFDFRLPAALNWFAAGCMAVLGLIFLLQGIADIAGWPPLTELAYGALGQVIEKFLGYVFIGWCIAVVLRDSEGRTRVAGIAVLALLMGVEIFNSAVSMSGGTPDGRLKLLYVLLFAWLILESAKPRAEIDGAGLA